MFWAISIVKDSNFEIRLVLISLTMQESRSQLSNTLAESREVAADLKAKIDDNEILLAPRQAERRQANEEKSAQRLAKWVSF